MCVWKSIMSWRDYSKRYQGLQPNIVVLASIATPALGRVLLVRRTVRPHSEPNSPAGGAGVSPASYRPASFKAAFFCAHQ